MKYHCCDRLRRNAVAAHPTLNGLDYLEVLDRDLPGLHPFRQRTLFLHFLKPIAGLNRDNLRLTGGDRVRNVQIEWAEVGVPAPAALTVEEAALLAALPDEDRVLVIRTDSTGDRSSYRLQLVRSPLDDRVPIGFDPQLAEIDFSFKVECDSEFDCKQQHLCPTETWPAPEINYLAKDYASFRRLLLDRMTQLLPDWKDRPGADTGVALTELLAYLGDHLSYRQDAAATEAYLGTARKRVSLRRHALLVDYAMHDGCNARAWIHVRVNAALVTLNPDDTRFLTECQSLPVQFPPNSNDFERAMRLHPEVFEPLHAITLRQAHNELPLYTWGDRRCCLARGATRATLHGHFADLAVGDLVLFEELLGPTTGVAGDADPQHRHVVRLAEVHHSDGVNPLTDPLNGEQVTEIAWAEQDALPFPLCISSVTDEEHGSVFLDKVSVARGNILLADHGRTIEAEAIGKVPAPKLLRAPVLAGDRCEPASPLPVPARFRPQLARKPLTQAGKVWRTTLVGGQVQRELVSFDPNAPAAHAMRWAMADVQPQIELIGTLGLDVNLWKPKRNLLNSPANANEFVVEIDDDGSTALRFGDDTNGHRPEQGTEFVAGYRVGNGIAGNVGAESIKHIITAEDGIELVRNALPARGGIEPESAESVRRRAPEAFRRQERAVTPEDYAEVSERHNDVSNAAATLRWTGSWHTVFLTVDREGGDAMTPTFTDSLQRHLDRYRMAGHDLDFHDPIYVPLELALHVCVKPNHFRSDVKRGLNELFSNRVLRDGRRGLFHPDNFSFGQSVYLSRLYAAAHAVPGVLSVQVTAFRRQGSKDVLALAEGRITLGRLEIARLDNDPNYPERGVLSLELHGGK
jgi:hypothetical protein